MSHFITLRTQIRERELLLEALEQLGHHVHLEARRVRGDRGEEAVEFTVATGCDSQIGFRAVEAGEIGADGRVYEIVADWYNVELATPLERGEFLDRLSQRYAYCVVKAQARDQDLVIEEEVDADGEIVLVLSERG